MTDEQRLNELITARLTGIIDADGTAELESLLRLYPEQRATLALLEQYWDAVPVAGAPTGDAFRNIMDVAEPAHLSPEKTITKGFSRKSWAMWAAAAVTLLGMFFLFRPGSRSPQQIVRTADGERKTFRLADASTIHLNGGSQLRCVVDGSRRELWLEGEAYFEVAPDPSRPFIVHASGVNIHALGTAFNVKAYHGQPSCETTLLEGAVEVYADKTPDSRIRLRPYEKVSLDATASIAAPVKKINLKTIHAGPQTPAATVAPLADSSLTETAWVSNRLQFDEINFEELARLLQRWYGVHITFRDEKPKHYVFSGAFAGETVTQALDAMQLIEDFRYEVQGNMITIFSTSTKK
ncbi:FecR domain-containing protein [Chitinophaga varians]|uniref:FecR domain-containing protein n=1 Tax=Chitinophaga varians TaxID=2202339 RepID=UPI00165FAEC1|nr:FecR domain-containing protein [Chitinophaga varians]MBC9909295.1 FecR domain-containing protein [Chitinophaga varians]